MTKIAIISECGKIWAVPAWQQTIPVLQKMRNRYRKNLGMTCHTW